VDFYLSAVISIIEKWRPYKMRNKESHHIISDKIYMNTFIFLLVFTIITVIISRIDLGILNTPIAIGIALVKATVVALFFMGLKWEKGINLVLVWGAIIGIIIFFGLTFADISFRGDISEEETLFLEIQPEFNNHGQKVH